MVATGTVIRACRLETHIACVVDTLAERYEQIMSFVERITRAGYQVKVQWECEFEPHEDTRVEEENLPLRKRDTLYGGRPRPCGYITKKKGLVRCIVLPPWYLYHLVLPYRCNSRLLFCLCRTCAESGSKEQCCHETGSERAVTAIGSWTN